MKINAIAFSFAAVILTFGQITAFAKYSQFQSSSCRICEPISKNESALLKDIFQKTFKKKATKFSQKLNKQHSKNKKGFWLCLFTVLACALIAWLSSFIPLVGGIVTAIVLLVGFGFLLSCLLVSTLACRPINYVPEEEKPN
jgi:Flp pilus assembly protein TadB